RDAFDKANDNFTELYTDKAPLDSPALTGTPTAPTPSANDNSTQIATTAYVDASVATGTTLAAAKAAMPPSVSIPFGDGTNEIEAGAAIEFEIPVGCTLTTARLLADASGDIEITVTASDYASYPTFSALDVFSLSSAQKGEETGLSHALSAGDVVRCEVTGTPDTITAVTLA